MSKVQYTRENINADCLRRIVILIDYNRLSNEDRWIDIVKGEFCAGVFLNYSPILPEQSDLDRYNIDRIAKRLEIPVSEYKRNIIHYFINSTDAFNDNVRLEVSRYSLGLTIDVRHEYDGLTKYQEYVVSIITKMLKMDPFIEIKRIGIRKFDVFEFDDAIALRRDLEETTVFSNKIEWSLGNLERFYKDSYYSQKDGVYVNYTRQLNVALNNENKEIFQVVIDSDIYINKQLIKLNQFTFPSDLRKALDRLNNKSFEIFRNSVTAKYLHKNCRNNE